MKTQQLISLLFEIDALLENNKKIREGIIKLLAEEEEKPDRQQTVASLTDILGIKVYLGKDYIEPDKPIVIGEEITTEEINNQFDYLEDEYINRTIDLWR
jgi:hypothetical protein